MTNHTPRTRAEIQAPPPEVFGSVAWDMKLIAMIGDVADTYKHTDEFAPYWSQICRLLDFVRVTAASDLIPREEHERAVEEARKVTTTDAMAKLVQELKDDEFQAPAIRMDWSDFSSTYRVTVERVDADADKSAPSQAVAPSPLGIVRWLRDYEESLRYQNKQCLADQIRKCWQGITELPEPSDDVAYYDDDRLARIAFPSGYFIGLQHSNEALQLAADCIKAAALLKNEGRISAPKPDPPTPKVRSEYE